jgi:tetratricopeptide (TPR) repeat protein
VITFLLVRQGDGRIRARSSGLKRELKKQIKQDELVTGFEQGMAWVKVHWPEVRITLIVLAVVGVAGGALAYFQTHRGQEAERAFAEAHEIFQTPLAKDQSAGAEPPAGPTFGSKEEKFKKAAAAFDGVERRFATLPVAVRARYYGALCRMELGRLDEAEKALNEAVAGKHDLEGALGRLALADLYYRRGDVGKAVDAYRQFVSDAAVPFPRDYALMRLGSILEETKKLAEATASYRRLTEEFPTSVYAQEARRRVEYLQTVVQG